MPGPNLRDLVGDIREAVERLPKEALVDILVYVFKEYVVEGSAPLATGAAPVHDDLTGMSFAEVIRALQLRLDLPELELFSVEDSGRVVVRAGGRPVPIEVASTARPVEAPVPPQPAPPPPVVVTPAAAAPSIARAAAAAAPVENRSAAIAGGARSAAAPVENRPAGSPGASPRPGATPAENRPAGGAAAQPAAAAPKPEPPRTGGLLEID